MNNLRATPDSANTGSDRRPPQGPLFRLWSLISRNLWLKLLSLLLAILLWNYVIATNNSITRPKTLFGITGYVSGQSALNSNGLALLEDPETALSSISVTVEVPQTSYSRVSSDNVQVLLDLSNVRAAGTQEVRLRATTNYGRVTAISPASVTLTFEQLDSRSVPVNCQIVGDETQDIWYNVARVNPSVISVSGAASKVRSIASANVAVNVADIASSTMLALPYVLLNGSGEEIGQGMLNRSTSSISVSLDAWPSREIPVANRPESVLTGQPAEGCQVRSVHIQPETVLVAGEADLLDGITELAVEPVSVEGMSQSFSARASISVLSDLRYVSNEQVYVNVVIGPAPVTRVLETAEVTFAGLAEGRTASCEGLRITATGEPDAVDALERDGLRLTVDVSGLSPGTYRLVPEPDAGSHPDVELTADEMTVTIRSAEESD